MKQDIEKQYDDDLTLGADEYDDSYYTDADDLFDLSTNDESPISRLKSLVLSIDWEITDEVLLQFNEELIDLKGIWAGNSINLVYVQALEKLSKYIYQNKANSHPNAIKLLLTLYYNLEKIVSSEELTEDQKKEILLEDVKRFESLKRQIVQITQPGQRPSPVRPQAAKVTKEAAPEDQLLSLKAIVLGIDWEITDHELNNLRREVFRLEEQYATSKPKLILLQGIGTMGAYIKTKKSNAHADAFKVLHLFYESLERIVKTPMSLQEEKAILFHAVAQFNDFKALIGPTISPEKIGREEDEEEDEEFEESGSGQLAPALADVSDEERGFQAEEEARSLGIDSTSRVTSHLDNFFGEHVPPPVDEERGSFPGDPDESPAKEKISAAGFHDAEVPTVEKQVALQGVDVEADDEEDDTDGYTPGVAALADAEDGAVSQWQEISNDAAGGEALVLADGHPAFASEEEIASAADSLFPDGEVPSPKIDYGGIDREAALQGVNVETEADEDSDEISLPMDGEHVAPALMTSEEESLYSARTLETSGGDLSEEITGTLDDLFLDEEQVPAFVALETAVNESFISEASGEEGPEKTEDASSPAEGQPVVEEAVSEIPETDDQPAFSDAEVAQQEDETAAIQKEEDLNLFFTGSDLEQNAEVSAAVDALFENLEEHPEESDREIPAAADEVTLGEEDEMAPGEEDFWVTETMSPNVERIEEEPLAEPEAEAPLDAFEEAASPAAATLPENEVADEEVVFELAEAEAEPVPVATVAPAPEEPDVAFATEPEGALVDEVTEDLAEPVRDEEETLSVVAATPLAGFADEMPSDPLIGLRGCIESLGIELSEKIINGLFEEINRLRQKWSNRPLEKTFLQLLSTITQHIDSCRFEADSDAHSLLHSVYKALAARREDDLHYNQELLLTETLKVLEWQQGMLTRQAVQKGSQSMFTAPRTAEEAVGDVEVDARQDFDQLLQEYQEGEVAGPAIDEPLEVQAGPPTGPGRSLAAELKQEIAALRKTLQLEIAELRSELKGR